MKPYHARNIGFGLPAGRFFKVTLTAKDGPSIATKVGADYESDAKEEAMRIRADWLAERGGIADCRARECGQFQAV